MGTNNISLKYNYSTKTCELKSSFDINFTHTESIFRQLGFEQIIYTYGNLYVSKLISSEKISIEKTTNLFHYSSKREIKIDTGIYNIHDIERTLKHHLGDSNIFF